MNVDYSLKPVFFDLETRSMCSLRTDGAVAYSYDPTTEILCFGWKDGVDGETKFSLGSTPPQELLDLAVMPDRVLVAHNGFGFDNLIWETRVGAKPNAVADSIPLLRAEGLPASLDKAAGRMLDRSKLRDGAYLIEQYCVPVPIHKRKCRFEPHFKKDKISKADAPLFEEYCKQDVELLADLWKRIEQEVTVEADVIAVSHAVNDRGISVDVPLVAELQIAVAEVSIAARQRASEITGIPATDIGSNAKINKWLEAQGVEITKAVTGKRTLAKAEVAEYLDSEEAEDAPGEVGELLRCRQAFSGVIGGKLQALARRTHDRRLRYSAEYHGAHTGRWAGRGVQVQNLPKSAADPAPLLEHFDRAGRLPPGLTAEQLTAMLRPCFVADGGHELLIADFAGIEARVLAWLAHEPELLATFGDPDADVYCMMAAKIFGKPVTKKDKAERAVGKLAVLGLGYQMGPTRFESMCRQNRADLKGLRPEDVVAGYRAGVPAIAGEVPPGEQWARGGFWKELQAGWVAACRSPEEVVRVGSWVSMVHSRGCLRMRLPSGREVVYREAGLDPIPDKFRDGAMRETPAYTDTHDLRVTTYGGKLAENCVTADTLVLTERRGTIPIVAVTPADRVWDGRYWVRTGGVVASGVAPVGEWLGVRVTADHRVLTGPYPHEPSFRGRGWVAAGELTPDLSRRAILRDDSRRMDLARPDPDWVWKDLGRSEPVFDLLDCGPRHRFAVVTDLGLALVHNCTQAVARDLLADALVRAEAAGLNPVLHVHDEIVCSVPKAEAPEALRKLLDIMSRPPPWCPGMPLKTEGYAETRYLKSPRPGYARGESHWDGDGVVTTIEGDSR